jgi:methanogenic corrinoid protein MtbC1
MVADLLRCGGFSVSDIGADVPAESFARAVTGVDDLVAVCVGVTVADALDNARASIAAVRAVTNAPCIVGGAAVVSDELAAELGADARIDDVRALIERLQRRAK